MKRIVFPVLMVVVVLLAACGGKTAAPASSEPVAITFSAWGAPEELAVWNQIVSEFEAANPGIKVNVEVSDWDAYWDKLKTQLAANTPPDVFAMDAPLFLDYQTRGVLANLQPFIDKNPDMLKDVYPQTLEAYKTADGYYGLPRDFQTIVLFYNKDMFDAAGVAYPTADWTWDDVRAAAKKLTLDTNGDGTIEQYGFVFDQWDMEPGWSEALWSQGGDIISPDHTKTLVGEPASRKGWQTLYDMVFVDKSSPDANTIGQYGLGAGFAYDAAPMPAGDAGHATSVNSAGFVVANASKHPAEAFEFIKYVMSQTGQTRLAELGFAIPVLKTVAESPVFLQQSGSNLNQQVFLDSLAFSHMKPVFKGYDEWAAVVGDGMGAVWRGEAELSKTLDEIVPLADEVLAKNK
jgi:multiple sugar transport system substrate-binding protein